MSAFNSRLIPKPNFFKKYSFLIFSFVSLFAHSQNDDKLTSRDLSYLTSGGKLHPLQAIMDIRHYTIALEVDIKQQSINGSVEVSMNLSKKTDTILLNLVHLFTVTKITVNKILRLHIIDPEIFCQAESAHPVNDPKIDPLGSIAHFSVNFIFFDIKDLGGRISMNVVANFKSFFLHCVLIMQSSKRF